jgi:hypothetical protein
VRASAWVTSRGEILRPARCGLARLPLRHELDKVKREAAEALGAAASIRADNPAAPALRRLANTLERRRQNLARLACGKTKAFTEDWKRDAR